MNSTFWRNATARMTPRRGGIQSNILDSDASDRYLPTN